MVIRKRINEGFTQLKIESGYSQYRKMNLMNNLMSRCLKKWVVVQTNTFCLFKIQHIMRNLTVIYYIGANILKKIFDRRLGYIMETLRTKERLEKYRMFYSSFWKWKISNIEAKYYVEFLKVKEKDFGKVCLYVSNFDK